MPAALFAYIDPGSGTLLVQAAIAAVCTGLFCCRQAACRVLTLLVRRRKNAPPELGATAVSALRSGPGIPSAPQRPLHALAGHPDSVE